MNTDLNFEKLKSNLQSQEIISSTNPIMLALSTFKHSDKAIKMAIEMAFDCKKLVIVYGHEVNPWLYFMGTDFGIIHGLKEQCEIEILIEIEREWEKKIDVIATEARAKGLKVATYVKAKKFKKLYHEVFEKEKPSLVITTKSRKIIMLRC